MFLRIQRQPSRSQDQPRFGSTGVAHHAKPLPTIRAGPAHPFTEAGPLDLAPLDHAYEREAEAAAHAVDHERPNLGRSSQLADRDGQPLPDGTRSYFEGALGVDLRQARIHAGVESARAARRLGADAFTFGTHIAFDSDRYQPASRQGRRLLAHELTHVAQHFRLGPRERPRVWRKIKVRGPNEWLFFKTWHELSPSERRAFAAKWFPGDALARAIVDDMADAGDDFRFEDTQELRVEVFKRADTSRRMRESQKDLGAHGKSFGYPSHTGKGCGPRVNKAARKYWGPVQYDAAGSYYFELTPEGKKDAYNALTSLFTPQANKCDRTLIHCDYLASVVHYRVFAETIGVRAFNDRVAHGKLPLTLKWNGFADIEPRFLRSSERVSLQEVRPSSERDLVIGDHVIFWNHRAYDLINWNLHEAWRLENAVLVDKARGQDIFLGHGSGERTNTGMREKLASMYNDVASKGLALVAKTKNPHQRPAAVKELAKNFEKVKEVGGEWRIQGFHFRKFDEKLQTIKPTDPELVGLRDPADPKRMNLVKRPIESA